MEIKPQFSQLLATGTALLLFGVLLNQAVATAARRNYLEGYTWLAVTIGVLGTLAGVALIDWRAAALSLAAFVISGGPMVAGSVQRYVTARNEEQERVRQAAALAEQRTREPGSGR